MRHEFLTLIYADRGSVIFDWVEHEWQVFRVEAAGAQLSAESIEQDLQSDNPLFLRSLARRMYDTGERDPAVLAQVATRVTQDMDTDDRHLIDAFAWFCRAMGASGRRELLPALGQIAEQADSKKLRKYAKAAVKQLE